MSNYRSFGIPDAGAARAYYFAEFVWVHRVNVKVIGNSVPADAILQCCRALRTLYPSVSITFGMVLSKSLLGLGYNPVNSLLNCQAFAHFTVSRCAALREPWHVGSHDKFQPISICKSLVTSTSPPLCATSAQFSVQNPQTLSFPSTPPPFACLCLFNGLELPDFRLRKDRRRFVHRDSVRFWASRERYPLLRVGGEHRLGYSPPDVRQPAVSALEEVLDEIHRWTHTLHESRLAI
ncbi:hypothetical protein EDD16DRAFT_1517422 [Pisolithus croceorrhizus]|nr:hypothetical protein EDD16DRAFT_1517422 [Pisolithus croceorrhizus]KAI6130105.1 hypothetical protein EV401DRAFT_1884551 [Pisolithus croceorrhizus]KAI6160430.1 hypothetical protein EDD17DRAFT_1510392 [Pisolithus thermaeus]